jgi:MFS family permease
MGTEGIPRSAGTRQGITLISLSMLPILAIAGLVADLPVLLGVFRDVPQHEFLVPMVLTLPSLCVALFSSVAGVIADRWGRRPLLLLALAGFSLLGLAPLLLSSLPSVLASRVVVGLAEASILTCTNTLWGDYFVEDARRRWLGFQQMSGPVFNALLALAGGALAARDWAGPFWLYLLGLPGLLLAYLFLYEPLRTTGAPARSTNTASMSVYPWTVACRIAPATLGVSIVFFMLAIQQGRVFAALGARSPALSGQLIMLVSLAAILGAVAFNALRMRAVAQLLAFGLTCYGLGYVGISLARSLSTGAAASALGQFASSIVLPALIAWTLTSFPPEHRGRGIGLWGAVFFAGQFVSAPLLTVLEHLAAGLPAAFGVVGVAALAAAALTALSHRKERT